MVIVNYEAGQMQLMLVSDYLEAEGHILAFETEFSEFSFPLVSIFFWLKKMAL